MKRGQFKEGVKSIIPWSNQTDPGGTSAALGPNSRAVQTWLSMCWRGYWDEGAYPQLIVSLPELHLDFDTPNIMQDEGPFLLCCLLFSFPWFLREIVLLLYLKIFLKVQTKGRCLRRLALNILECYPKSRVYKGYNIKVYNGIMIFRC